MARRRAGDGAGDGTTRSGRRLGVRRGYQLIAAGLVTTAVVKELRTPSAQRTWHGDLAGVVPYDLRRPTLARARERMWAPDDPHLIVPRAFGVGWTLNLGRVVRLVRDRHAASD